MAVQSSTFTEPSNLPPPPEWMLKEEKEDIRYNEEKCMKKANEIIKSLGIKKNLLQLYDDYVEGKKTNPKLKKYLDENGMMNYNPWHIYNQWYYWNGETDKDN